MFKKFPATRRVLIYVILSYLALVLVNNSGLEYGNMWVIYTPMFVAIYIFSAGSTAASAPSTRLQPPSLKTWSTLPNPGSKDWVLHLHLVKFWRQARWLDPAFSQLPHQSGSIWSCWRIGNEIPWNDQFSNVRGIRFSLFVGKTLLALLISIGTLVKASDFRIIKADVWSLWRLFAEFLVNKPVTCGQAFYTDT